MEFILYDTEYTSWEGSLQRLWTGEGEEREIVQISAILVKDLQTLNGTEFFSVYTKPIIKDFDPLREELKNFINSIAGKEEPIVDGINARNALALAIKINKLILRKSD